MSKPKYIHSAGFLGTGAACRTFLANLPWLDAFLGPVFTPVRRATPRVVKALGAGFSAIGMEELRGCRYLLVCATPKDTRSLLDQALSEGVLDGVDILALVEHSSVVDPPAEVTARVSDFGSLSRFPNRQRPAYLVEGSLRFRRFCQQLLDVPLRRLIVAQRDTRAMVDAGVFLAEEFCLPLLEAIQMAFIAAGIAADQAREMGAELLREAVENAQFAGRKRWTGILHSQDERRLGEILQALHKENELLAGLVLTLSRQGLAVMGKDIDWIENMSNGHSLVASTAARTRGRRNPSKPDALPATVADCET